MSQITDMMRDGEHAARDAMDRSRRGAPAAGAAVRDIFSADEVFQRLTATADEEFQRDARLLMASGLAAGLSIALSFFARAAVTGALPDGASQLLGNLLYPVGFALIVLGRYQLFTENTLTPVTLVLTRIASLPALLRLWGVVLAANVAGAGVMAWLLANTGVFTPEAEAAARSFGEHALEVPADALFWKAVLAGWLVASMVWLVHAVRDNTTRLLLVFVIMYLIPTADLFHCVIGACEALFLVFTGDATLGQAVGFFTPVVLGNTVGGVLLVGILNFAQTRERRFPDRDCRMLELSWREWLFGQYVGLPATIVQAPDDAPRRLRLPVEDVDHTTGDPAGTDVVVYGDYECPFTSATLTRLAPLWRDGGPARLVFRHFPQPETHPYARGAATAAEAAHLQGRFWAYHELLLANQNALGQEDLRDYAAEVGLDVRRFVADCGDGATRERVERDVASGRASGVNGTPVVFVDDQRWEGDVDGLLAHLDADALAGSP